MLLTLEDVGYKLQSLWLAKWQDIGGKVAISGIAIAELGHWANILDPILSCLVAPSIGQAFAQVSSEAVTWTEAMCVVLRQIDENRGIVLHHGEQSRS